MESLTIGGPGFSLKTLAQIDEFDRSCKAEKLHDANAPPVKVDLVPGKSVPGCGGICMVIIMPAFTKGEEGYPPVVSGIIAR